MRGAGLGDTCGRGRGTGRYCCDGGVLGGGWAALALLTNADGGMEGCATENKINQERMNTHKLGLESAYMYVDICAQLQIHHTCMCKTRIHTL